MALWASFAGADSFRVATFNTNLHGTGPGVMLRDILAQQPHPMRVAALIADAKPDVIVLQNIDYDFEHHGLTALRDLIATQGHEMGYLYAPEPNSGWPTGLDLDGDGTAFGPRDAQGYGRFPGQRGLAILSTYPIAGDAAQIYTDHLWAEVADLFAQRVILDRLLTDNAQEVQRLSSVAHVAVPIRINGKSLTLLTHHATPPIFDGPEDRNGFRNAAENLLWLYILDGTLGPPPPTPLILAAMTNLDPWRGAGQHGAMRRLLDSPAFVDPARNIAPSHRVTSRWPESTTGDLRLSYLLPSPDLKVLAGGRSTLAPAQPPLRAHPHALIWLDLAFEPAP
ncbi:endonuclease/exonuclease/phosphatase family protein [Cognatishimia sp. SS12]|uniref:endonuclease/exonuclease/phosphatase family protein n=1 Tax=Cognatishimia sp. SS12 TaxID=2979465 RepID=UPI00232D4AB0|nr:endonuclease/exonuclease/phosphatase family protein [Cognatishimia sp. SS12]MDC0739209.1 endonuclease/exonuclease/phosphatase family protein [Cognatishimia sp. SS12]